MGCCSWKNEFYSRGHRKTTITVNLGVGLANAGRKVLLVDADPQGDLSTSLGWTDPDNLPVTLSDQLERIILDWLYIKFGYADNQCISCIR